jgi:hypothetical protein
MQVRLVGVHNRLESALEYILAPSSNIFRIIEPLATNSRILAEIAISASRFILFTHPQQYSSAFPVFCQARSR